jgi:hypothetical protein
MTQQSCFKARGCSRVYLLPALARPRVDDRDSCSGREWKRVRHMMSEIGWACPMAEPLESHKVGDGGLVELVAKFADMPCGIKIVVDLLFGRSDHLFNVGILLARRRVVTNHHIRELDLDHTRPFDRTPHDARYAISR